VSAYTDFFPDLFAFAALVVVAIAAAPLAARIGLPGPAAFLGVGIVAGALDLVPVDELSALNLEQVGTVALYAILFQGGLVTGFRAWRRSAQPILVLGLPGTAVTAAALAAFAHYVLRLDWVLAAPIGIALAPTDPAAVYSVLRGKGDTRARTILEGESGFNDPIGISLMVAAVAYFGPDHDSVADGALRFLQEIGIGAAIGVVAGLALVAALRASAGLPDELQGAGLLAAAVLVGAGTATLHGSGFLAVYIAGLLLADAWRRQDGSRHVATEAAAAISEPLLFGLLGAAFATAVGWSELGYGIALTVVTALLLRPLVAMACTTRSGLAMGERRLVAWGGLKGAVPLLLAAYPALESLDGARRVEGIVLVATACSIVLQGATLKRVAQGARTGARAPAQGLAYTPGTVPPDS